MKPAIALLTLFLFFANYSFAKEYGEYDPKKILTVTKTENGEKYGLDLQYLDRIINDLALHAKNYPPKFDNDGDKNRATKDTQILSGMLENLVNNSRAAPELLRRTSLLNSIGHNLDISGAAQKADRDFQNLLKQLPNDPAANFAYGAFLGGVNQGGKALPYLEKAVKAGYTDAYYSLGMAYLTQSNTEMALRNFEIYKNHNPKDQSVVKIIEAIKSGDIQFKAK